NWSGNRVTCRDWFQLSLKEGFTVYRDQCFSADMGSAAVKRIEDVRILRAAQFPEDGGPLAHPIRPDSYQEISNFYTATVYNKGAEVIRMMATMAGEQRFRAGSDLYFDRHDGQAATCEDFVCAMEDGAAIDLTQFRLWYSQAGTPRVAARVERAPSGDVTLHLSQTMAATPGQANKQPMQIPLRVKLFDPQGMDGAGGMDGTGGVDGAGGAGQEALILLNHAEMAVPCGVFSAMPVLSFNRGFSAPIIADVARAPGDLAWLAQHDDDPFAKYEALQALMIETLVARIATDAIGDGGTGDSTSSDDGTSGDDSAGFAAVVSAVGDTLSRAASDPAFVAEACALPTESFLGDQMLVVDPDAIRRARRALQRAIGTAHGAAWRALATQPAPNADDRSPLAKGQRKLRGLALMMLWASDAADAATLALAHYHDAGGMTDRIAALGVLAHSDGAPRDAALAAFYDRYHGDALVLDKWFSIQAFSLRADTVDRVAALASHADFTLANPNRVRSLYGAFAGNQACFHQADGRGYELLVDLIIALDPKNPQTAARMVPPLGRWKRFDDARAAKMRAGLARI
ncbi:MAG: DUF3458 domain-containing protein, partial [Sphingopyxis sp.]